MALAIKAENLSKAYQLGEIGTGTLSRDLERWLAKVRGKEDPFLILGETNDRTTKGAGNVVWSLKDINFEIQEGDAVGIIGRNGAGKSTLLKLLSRVTSPTTGNFKVKGRIASLLEVGTGFHPELSGRENIYLNGAILGMRKKEINKKFDEIVDFSGVERYIDTPVKRYSSGMYVRLAFAVAAYLESEILIVDEVLAVGDAEFQSKCLGKMNEVSEGEGRTILFVSHNLAAIQKLCKTGIMLQNGRLTKLGTMKYVIGQYLSNDENKVNEKSFKPDPERIANALKVELMDEKGNSIYEISIGDTWIIKVYFEINIRVDNFISAIGIVSPLEIPINTSWQKPMSLSPGLYCTEFKQSEIVFATGRYKINIGLSIGLKSIQFIHNAIDLNIIPYYGDNNEKYVKFDANTSAILNQLEMITYQV